MVDEVVIRQANETDAEGIWDLLLADSKMVDIEKIRMNIRSFFVIIYQGKIISVMKGIFTPGVERVQMVAVHPMYPEKTVALAMICALLGVVCRNTPDYIRQGMLKEIKFGNWLKSGLADINSDKIIEGVINEFSSEQEVGISYLPTTEGTD